MMIQVLVLPFSSSSLSLCFVIKVVVVVVGRLDYYMIDYLKNEIWCEDSGLPLIQMAENMGQSKHLLVDTVALVFWLLYEVARLSD